MDEKTYQRELKRKREALRRYLHNDQMSIRYRAALCGFCMLPMRQAMDLHEVILTRRNVERMSFEARLAIHTDWNCVLLHPECHVAASGKDGRSVCVALLITRHTRRAIQNQLETFAQNYGYHGIIEKLRLLEPDPSP